MSSPHDTILIKNKQGQFKTVDLENKVIDESLIDVDNMDKKNRIDKKEKKELEKVDLKDLKKDSSSLSPQSKIKKNNMPQPIASEVAAPSFYFNLEDEQEAEQFKDKDKVHKQQTHKENLKQKAEEIIKQIDLKLDETHKKRLLNALESYFRGVRSIINLKEVLIRPVDLGGIGLENEQVEAILEKTKQGAIDKQQVFSEKEEYKKEEIKLPEKPIIKDKQEVKSPVITRQDVVKPPEIKKQFVAQPEKQVKQRQKVQIPKQEVIQDKKEKVEEPKKEAKLEKSQPQMAEQVTPKSERKIFGPVEELASYDLNSFRNLAPTPKQSLDKIKDKILLLQDESYEKRAQAIKAWRSSPVYQNYLSLGQESMEQGKSVKQIIYDYKEQNKPTLSFEEFEAISDFNEEIND